MSCAAPLLREAIYAEKMAADAKVKIGLAYTGRINIYPIVPARIRT
jgi:hypothetical protein